MLGRSAFVRSSVSSATKTRQLSASSLLQLPQDWSGTGREDHTTETTDDLDIQSAASKKGLQEKQESSSQSSAISEKDAGKSNVRAEKETKAPGVVLGMNDERGGVRLKPL